MNYFQKRLSTLIACLLLAPSAFAFDFDLEGIYKGEMTLTDDGRQRSIPLALSLVLTDETEPGFDEFIIDGVILVDEEGGPYALSKVSVDIEDLSIDMRYYRAQRSPGDDSPANFRLAGFFNADGSIEGQVFSAIGGLIGSFTVNPSDEDVLSVNKKYAGRWQGVAELTNGEERVPFRVVLNDSLQSHNNPPNYEFEFTPGKIGSIKWNRSQIAISEVTIDYLRRNVVLYHRGNSGSIELSIQFTMDFSTGKIHGAVNSSLNGRTATFSLDSVGR